MLRFKSKIVRIIGISSYITVFNTTLPALAGTAAYTGKCSYIDNGNNNGGSVTMMPCFVREGGNQYGAFFYVYWQDGIQTKLDASAHTPFKEEKTGRTFQRIERYKVVADDDGDVITLSDAKYTSNIVSPY